MLKNNLVYTLLVSIILLNPTLSKASPDKSSDAFDCSQYISQFKTKLKSSSINAQQIKNVGLEWLCLKNGSISIKNASYLKSHIDGKFQNLERLNLWSKKLISELSSLSRNDQILFFKDVLNHFPNELPKERKLLSYGIEHFMDGKMNLKQIVKGYCLSDIYESEIEKAFIL